MKTPIFAPILRKIFYFDNWPMVLFQRMFCRRARLLAFRRGQIEFVVDYRGLDQCGILPCLTGDMYSRYFGLFERTRPLKVLDLGANAGGFSLALLAAGFAFEKLVCVEMNPRTYVRLQFNISQNFECETVVLNAAVAGQSGVVRISASHGGTSQSIYVQQTGTLLEITKVTLDEIMQAHFGADPGAVIDLCKIDVEGSEFELFQNATCQLIRRVKHLIIEIHPHPTVSEAELLAKICSFGFEVVANPDEDEKDVFLLRNRAW